MNYLIRSEVPERRLLGGRFAPVTNLIEFIEADAEFVAQSLLERWGEDLTERTGYVPVRRTISGDLAGILEQAAPVVTGVLQRWIIVPTDSGWTALMTNSALEHGRFASTGSFAHHGNRAIGIDYVKSTFHRKHNVYGVPGARKFTLCIPDPRSERRNQCYIAAVWMRENGSWDATDPDELRENPFPDPMDYSKRSKADRFTSEHIAQLAGLYGIRPFDADFYAPNNEAVFLENPQPREPEWLSLSYAEAQAR